MSALLDEVAIEAIMTLRESANEQMGALYRSGDGFSRTETVQGGNEHVRGQLKVPKGSLAALFHNHPIVRTRRGLKDAGGGELFSDDDKKQARTLGVPSYILTPAGKLMKYNPTDDSVIEIPIPVRTSGSHNTLTN